MKYCKSCNKEVEFPFVFADNEYCEKHYKIQLNKNYSYKSMNKNKETIKVKHNMRIQK